MTSKMTLRVKDKCSPATKAERSLLMETFTLMQTSTQVCVNICTCIYIQNVLAHVTGVATPSQTSYFWTATCMRPSPDDSEMDYASCAAWLAGRQSLQ